MKESLKRAAIGLGGVATFVAFGIFLEEQAGVSFWTTYRIACAAVPLWFFAKIAQDYAGERWPRRALLVAATFNIALLVSPFSQTPATKGDLLFFGLPDAIIFMIARVITYKATDLHGRAVRQQLIAGVVLALAVCAILFATLLIPDAQPHCVRC